MQRLLLSAMVRKHLGRSPLLVQDNVQRDLRIGIPLTFYVLLFCLIVFLASISVDSSPAQSIESKSQLHICH